MYVIFFKRKPAHYHFSIENLFDNIIKHLPADVKYKVSISRYINSGIFSKVYNLIEILFKSQGEINHVTGDVHYITFFLEKKKTVLTIHDLNLLYSPNKLKRLIHKWFWLRIPIMRSQTVTVISETTKQEVLKYANCNPDKIHVIYNCISPAFTPHPKKFNKNKPTLLHVGCKPNKNLSRVIEAVKGLECRLEIIGKPTEDQLALLQTYTIDFNYQTGLTEEEVVRKYQECDMLIFVSLLEGFGLPIVEANRVGRPVITSNLSSMPEIAGEAACLVNPYDTQAIRVGILKVINDDKYRDMLIQNGSKNSERFSAREIAKQYYKLYQLVLKN